MLISLCSCSYIISLAQTAPVLKDHKPPVCSVEANAAYASALVKVELSVDEHGKVKDAIVNDPTKEQYFYRSTWQIISKLRFKPAKLNGKPVVSTVQHLDFAYGCMPPQPLRGPVYREAATAFSRAPASVGGGFAVVNVMIFGGSGHQTYLGCLNCNQFSPESISNKFGTYGSSFSTSSVFNKYGQFGSLYSNFSMCNPYAGDPPVIVTKDGKFYGRLTANTANAERTQNSEWQKLIEEVCSSD